VELILVRHGESESNLSGRWQGHSDSALSETGRRQAALLARRLEHEGFDLVLSSDLSRAADTARALGRPVELDPGFREVALGSWEGLTRPEVAERFPEQVQALSRGATDMRIGGGESWDDMHERVDAALSELRGRVDDDARVLLFSHGGVISGLVAGLMGLRGRHPRPHGRISNTAVTRLRLSDEGAELLTYNDATHVGPMGEWAADRLSKGDPVLTLVSHAAHEEEDDPSAPGRSRGAGSMVAVERLGAWAGSFAHIYAAGRAPVRNAGAVLAERSRITLSDDAVDEHDLGAALGRLAEAHGGHPVGVLADASAVAGFATRVLAPGNGSQLARPTHTAVAHLVWSKGYRFMAAYNLAPHLEG